MHAWVLFEMQIPRTHPRGFWIQQLSAHQWALTVRMWPHRNVRFPSNTRRETVLENAWSRVPSCKQRHWLLNSQDNGKITDFQEARETGLGGSISRTHPNHSAALVWWEGGPPASGTTTSCHVLLDVTSFPFKVWDGGVWLAEHRSHVRGLAPESANTQPLTPAMQAVGYARWEKVPGARPGWPKAQTSFSVMSFWTDNRIY